MFNVEKVRLHEKLSHNYLIGDSGILSATYSIIKTTVVDVLRLEGFNLGVRGLHGKESGIKAMIAFYAWVHLEGYRPELDNAYSFRALDCVEREELYVSGLGDLSTKLWPLYESVEDISYAVWNKVVCLTIDYPYVLIKELE